MIDKPCHPRECICHPDDDPDDLCPMGYRPSAQRGTEAMTPTERLRSGKGADRELKPAVLSTLEGIADGYVEIEFDERRRYAFLKDWPTRAIVPGVFTLIGLGYLTDDAKITEAGRLALLAAKEGKS